MANSKGYYLILVLYKFFKTTFFVQNAVGMISDCSVEFRQFPVIRQVLTGNSDYVSGNFSGLFPDSGLHNSIYSRSGMYHSRRYYGFPCSYSLFCCLNVLVF